MHEAPPSSETGPRRGNASVGGTRLYQSVPGAGFGTTSCLRNYLTGSGMGTPADLHDTDAPAWEPR
jgi:hypothetical protein